ncbi:helix-turn-helix domain-containing protein [Kiritimatiella glycovorans]|uniref:AraC family transcriptional regulator n=1 Tax=Kiritimatiella glycovorans TaxID=1307763 RepID=A0A0G3EFT8_9BACT|nr:helix-turn-helix domain-containing protein [Kiritimatiella glycovorans]AKJ63675.1 AraC family transcriptional regulator [Kiritimatiella glycovorans]
MISPVIDRVQYGYACFDETSHPYERLHTHPDLELGMLSGGAVTAMIAGRRYRFGGGEIVAFWAGLPHGPVEVEGSPCAHNLCVPMDRLRSWNLPVAFISALYRGRVFRLHRTHPAANWVEWKQLLDGEDDTGRTIASLEINALLLRMIRHHQFVRSAHDKNGTPTNLRCYQEIATYIAAHKSDPITVGDILKHASVHPKYAMRIFKQSCGMTIHEYLVLQRMNTARHLLTTTDRNVTDIAFESGFGSVSRFYDAFSSAHGCTPGEYRRRFLNAG